MHEPQQTIVFEVHNYKHYCNRVDSKSTNKQNAVISTLLHNWDLLMASHRIDLDFQLQWSRVHIRMAI